MLLTNNLILNDFLDSNLLEYRIDNQKKRLSNARKVSLINFFLNNNQNINLSNIK